MANVYLDPDGFVVAQCQTCGPLSASGLCDKSYTAVCDKDIRIAVSLEQCRSCSGSSLIFLRSYLQLYRSHKIHLFVFGSKRTTQCIVITTLHQQENWILF
jgi:hypothetical protein